MTAITPFPIWWTLTRRMGFAAYFLASLACFFTWVKVRVRGADARAILVITGIEVFLCLDMVFEWRLALHALCAGYFIERNLYDQRHAIQLSLLVMLWIALMAGLVSLFRRFRGSRALLLASAGVSMSLTLWLVEIISMHETDAVLYYFINRSMVIAFLWGLASAITTAGVCGEGIRFAHIKSELRPAQ